MRMGTSRYTAIPQFFSTGGDEGIIRAAYKVLNTQRRTPLGGKMVSRKYRSRDGMTGLVDIDLNGVEVNSHSGIV